MITKKSIEVTSYHNYGIKKKDRITDLILKMVALEKQAAGAHGWTASMKAAEKGDMEPKGQVPHKKGANKSQ